MTWGLSSYWAGKKNAEPDALSRQHQREEKAGDVRWEITIKPCDMVLKTTLWTLECKVKASLPDVSIVPAGCPPGCLFAPSSLYAKVLKWEYYSQLACHPGVTRIAFKLAQFLW